jgi:CBS-domain-containing membrane protein
MQTQAVKELMVPISEYATVHENANMAEAMRSLENEQKRHGDSPYRHQSLVVLNSEQHVVGRLSQVDMMRALEPGYSRLGQTPWIGRSVLSKEVLKTLREQFNLWEQPIEALCQEVGKAKVKDYMQTPSEGEFVSKGDTLNVALHRIVMGRHHSLLVTEDREIIGILRSTDLFNALYDRMIACKEL